MSAEGITPEQYDRQLDHIVDTRAVSYAEAREMLGDAPSTADTFTAFGESGSTGIPKEVEEIPLGPVAQATLHIIEATPYRSQLKSSTTGPEIARMIQRGEISLDESDVLFSAIKQRKADLTAKPKEN